jgi:diguanylate cyclase (GGDEF)-like protein
MEETGLLEAALTDELTGLYNRRSLNHRLPQELKGAESSQKTLSLCILDIDYFKEINDSFGHRAARIANLLKGSIRDTDTVFRYAGDEFVVILPDTDNETALELAREIAERISQSTLEVLDRSLRMTISMGVATYPEDGKDLTTLSDFADNALYARKRRGRNGVCGRKEVLEDRDLLRPIFCPELVGRREELSRLKELLGFSIEGRGGLVLLSGEVGVGKTRLLNAFTESARRRGALTLSGRCFGEPTSSPYQPFKDALSKFAIVEDSERLKILQNLPDVYRNELLSLIPELMELGAEKSPTVDLAPAQARLRLYDAVRQFLLRISKEKPLTIILDDLHLADESSCQLLHYLARNLRESRVLICGAFRAEELEVLKDDRKPLMKAMHSMSRDALFFSISLRRLSRMETSRMIGLILNTAEIPEPFSERIFRETEGNPFFIEEVLKSLIEVGKVSTTSDLDKVDFDGLDIPAAIKDVIQRRLDMLDPVSQRILTFASVIRQNIGFDVLLLMSELNEGHLLDVIEGALRSQLIVEEGKEEYRFSHGKINETIYERIVKRKRRRLHRVVGESLERVYDERVEEFASDLSDHFHQAEEWERCFKYSYQAGKRAKGVYANDDAVLSYRRALDAFGKLGSREQEMLIDTVIVLHQDMGGMCALLGKYEDAITSYEEMRKGARLAGNRRAEGKALNCIGSVHVGKGSYDEALSCYDVSLTIRKEIGDRSGIAESLHAIGSVHHSKGSYDEALGYYGDAVEIYREMGDKSGIARSIQNIGGIQWGKGSYEEALRYLEDALAIYREMGDRSGIAGSIQNIGGVHWGKGFYDEALRSLEDALAIFREIGDKGGVAFSLNNMGAVHWGKGSYDEALRYYKDALEIYREIGDKRSIAYNLNNIGAVHWEKGSYDGASSYFEDALAMRKEIGDKKGIAMSLNSIGNVHRIKGSYDEALRYYEDALAIYREMGDKRSLAYTLNYVGEVYRNKGFYDEALRNLEDALAIRKEIGDRSGIVGSRLSNGRLKRELNLLEDASDLHEQALCLALEIGDRGAESQALTELGLDMLRSNKLNDSLSKLNEAFALAIKIKNTEAEVEALRGLGETYINLGESEKAGEAAGKLLSIAEKTNSRKFLAQANLLKARSLSPQEALPCAEKTLKLSEELGMPEFLWRAHQNLGRILKEKDDLTFARTHFQQAKAIVESIASKLSDRRVREIYLSKPEHRELFEKDCGT